MSYQQFTIVYHSSVYQKIKTFFHPIELRDKGEKQIMARPNIGDYDAVALAQYLKYEYHRVTPDYFQFAQHFYIIR